MMVNYFIFIATLLIAGLILLSNGSAAFSTGVEIKQRISSKEGIALPALRRKVNYIICIDLFAKFKIMYSNLICN